ncbi:MAG: response regulator [Pyrinomonadaceae bacterium]
MAEQSKVNHRFFKPFLLTITVLGSLAFVSAVARLDLTLLDVRFAVLFIATLFLSSRVVVPIPSLSSQISVSDTFVFLILLLYGPPLAIISAATEAAICSLRFSKKPTTVAFNWSCAGLSIFITSMLVQTAFGDITALQHQPVSALFVAAICTMAIVHYVCNSGLVAICAALKTGERIWHTWHSHYLWTSITYFAGASAAALIVGLANVIGFYALLITLPICCIVFWTYRTYLKNIESSAEQAEQAERHLRELSHYIAEQERIREQFSQIEKLSALGELASGVAHDFNNTLTGILGRAQLLLSTSDPEKIHRGLKIIIKTAEDGAKTVKRIQDFARQRKDHDFRSICVDQILQDASEITRPRWKNCAEASNVHINLDLRIFSKASIMGDDSELREVLVNMIFNAVDAMPTGGTLTLSTREQGNSVVISIADTGVGMSVDVCSRVFDPFFTTKGKTGLGLGLAVSFGIITRHGGTIEVNSRLGHGTEFRIILPIATAATITPSLKHEMSGATMVNRSGRTQDSDLVKLLVVDDEEFVRELLREILEAEGCEVHLAESGSMALQLFEQHQFDAVFTDIGMPGMSGWEFATAVRAQSEMIPIAVITGWGEAVGSDEQKNAGVDWVIAKPFTADRIGDLVKDIQRERGTIKKSGLQIVAA